MKRVQLFEFHELKWFPHVWRDMLTDIMSFFALTCRPYKPIVPKLKRVLETLRCPRVIDLGSGAAGSTLSVVEHLGEVNGHPIEVTLTDKYPNVPLFRQLAEASPERVTYCEEPVDATTVPEELTGFRTFFTSFHHFDVEAARAILRDAIDKGQGIGVFEYTERNFLVWAPTFLVAPLFGWLVTPFIRPFRWHRLLWTYAIPVWMVFGLWDGIVSCLRTYSPRELRDLTADLRREGYIWQIGRVRSIGACRITYLLGFPSTACTPHA